MPRILTRNVNFTNTTEAKAARVIWGLAPWVLWLLIEPVAAALFLGMAQATHRRVLVAWLLAGVALVVAWTTARLSHSRGFGRLQHFVNALAALGWIAAVVRWGFGGFHGQLMITYACGGVLLCLLWNIKYAAHSEGLQDVVPKNPHKAPAVDFGYLVRVMAGRAPAIRAGAEKAGKVVPAITAPWQPGELTAPAADGAAGTGSLGAPPTAAAYDKAAASARAIVSNFRNFTLTKAPELNGAQIKVLTPITPHRIRTEIYLLRGIHTPKHILDMRDHLASQNAMPLDHVIARPNPRNHSRVFVDWVLEDVLAQTRFWPGPQAIGKSIADAPVGYGMYEDGVVAESWETAITPAMAKRLGIDQRNLSHIILEGMTGSGKALALDTPVPTPAGWTTMGELKAGDVIFDERGKPCRVTDAWAVRHGRPCYELTFSDGSAIVADTDHQWEVDTRKSRVADHNQLVKRGARTADRAATGYARRTWPQVLTTGEMADSVRTGNGGHLNYSIRVAAPLKCPDAALPVPPYVLGAWLGDGHSAGGRITCFDEEIIAAIEAAGQPVTPGARGAYGLPGLAVKLRTLGVLGNKHVPVTYLRASETQRRALLAGLLDTDGYCTGNGAAEFVSTRERLARDVLHLVSALGYKATLRAKPALLYGKDCGTAWTVAFTPGDKVFGLTRKAARQVVKTRATAAHRYVTAITPVPSVPVRCVAVDSPSHLFLVGETCIATHNSTTVRIVITDGATRLDVEDWALDPIKQYQTLGCCAGALKWFATDRGESNAMVSFLARQVIPARANYLGLNGYDEWEPGCGLPFLRVTVEEGGIIASELDRLDEVLNSARSAGVKIRGSFQRAQHALVDPNVRAAFGESLSYGCKDLGDAFVLPDELLHAGADPSVWKDRQPGMHYRSAAGIPFDRQMMPIRAWQAQQEVCTSTVARYAPVRDQWITDNCPDWQDMLRAIDTNGVYAARTTGEAVLDRMDAAARRKGKGRRGPLVPVADLPSQPAPADDGQDEDEQHIVDALIVDEGEDAPVTMIELDIDDPELAAGIAEDDAAGTDPHAAIPDDLDDDEEGLVFPAREEKPQLTREQALTALRGILATLGAGHEFQPNDIYEDACAATGRSPAWVRGELSTTLADAGIVLHDRFTGVYTVVDKTVPGVA